LCSGLGYGSGETRINGVNHGSEITLACTSRRRRKRKRTSGGGTVRKDEGAAPHVTHFDSHLKSGPGLAWLQHEGRLGAAICIY